MKILTLLGDRIGMIVVLFIFFDIPCQLCGMEKKKKELDLHKITLSVRLSAPYVIGGWQSRPDHKMYTTMLSGVCPDNNNIELVPYKTSGHTDKGIFYTPETILPALIEKKTQHYPLSWHKKIRQLNGNEYLEIIIDHAQYSDQPIKKIVPMADVTKKRLLRYLLHDVTEKQRNAFDLCKEVILEQAQPDKRVNRDESLLKYIDFIDQAHFKPGDMLGIFNIEACDDEGYSCLLKFGHYAFALGEGLYLCKLGVGGILYVSDLQSLKKFWKCSEHARINPAIGKNNYFMHNAFHAIAYRNIIMGICPKNISSTFKPGGVINHFSAWLSGVRGSQNQVKLRSDTCLSYKIDQHAFTTTEELYGLLCNGEVREYPLHGHKKLRYLVGDELLTICRAGEDNKATVIYFPSDMKRKLLAYLRYDSQDKQRDCFDFCNEICLNQYGKKEILDETIDYQDQWKYVREDELKSGDAIALGSMNTIKHFAVVLRKRIYISKFGDGGPLLVTDMQSMMDYFSCTGFVLIKPTITNFSKFWTECASEAPSISFNR